MNRGVRKLGMGEYLTNGVNTGGDWIVGEGPG